MLEEVEIVFLSLIIEERFHILVVRMTKDYVEKKNDKEMNHYQSWLLIFYLYYIVAVE